MLGNRFSLDWLNRFGPLLALFLVYGLFAAIAPRTFRALDNLELIARQTVVVGTVAIGMTLVITTAGIDLSVGSTVALTTMIMALVLRQEWDPLWAILAGVGSAALCGLVNGAIIVGHVGRVVAPLIGIGSIMTVLSQFGNSAIIWTTGIGLGVLLGAAMLWFNEKFIKRVPVTPFIVTLGTLLVVRGVAKFLGNEQKTNAPRSWLRELLSTLPPERQWMLLPPGVWIMLILAVLFGIVLFFTKLGRHIFAVGSNENTARLCGVAVERVKLYVYTLCGATAGIAGMMQFSRLNVGDPVCAIGIELDVIAAVVIGGGSLSGGEGSILGSLVGALIMTVIRSGCTQLGLQNYNQEMITGAIIVCAVAMDYVRHRNVK